MNVNLPHMNIADKVYFIASAIARSHQNDISMIWSMDSVVAAFDKELEEYSQLKIEARTKVSEQLKVFNNKFESFTLLSSTRVYLGNSRKKTKENDTIRMNVKLVHVNISNFVSF